MGPIKVFVLVSGLVLHYPYWDDPATKAGPHIRSVLVDATGVKNSAQHAVPTHDATLNWIDARGLRTPQSVTWPATIEIVDKRGGVPDPSLAMSYLPLFDSDLASNGKIRPECLRLGGNCLYQNKALLRGVVEIRGGFFGAPLSYYKKQPFVSVAGLAAWTLETLPVATPSSSRLPGYQSRPLAHGVVWSAEVADAAGLVDLVVIRDSLGNTQRLTPIESDPKTCGTLGAAGARCATIEILNVPQQHLAHTPGYDEHFDLLYGLFEERTEHDALVPYVPHADFGEASAAAQPVLPLHTEHLRAATGNQCFGGGGGHPWP